MNKSGNTTLARLVCDQRTARTVAEALSESFEADGAAVAVFERSEGRWAVEIHFPAQPDESAVRSVAERYAAAEGVHLVFETIEPKDWVAASLAGLKPVAAGRFMVHGAHDRARVAPNRIGIEIEAALAFGTGHHGTTRGCLLALDGILKQQRRRKLGAHLLVKRGGISRALDIGTGTGVLAIAAAKALRQPVLASDIDREAVAIARANARLNGVAPLMEYVRASGLNAHQFRTHAPFDLVLANILLAPLTRLAGPLRPLLAPHAHVVLSGLLAAQENAALAAYRPHGLKLVRRIPLGEWVTLVLRA